MVADKTANDRANMTKNKNSNYYMELENKYLATNYGPLPVILSKGEGCWLWDTEGEKYLDFLSAYSAVSAGHLNARIKKVMLDQLDNLAVASRAFHSDRLGLLAEALCTLTGIDKMLPMNTGAEAVETAIKAARRWGYFEKGIPDNQARIIVNKNNFHGRTTTITGFSDRDEYLKGFGPFVDAFDLIPFGDLEALEKAITPNTAAFLTEPMQGEAGIIIPEKGWLKEVQKICKKHNVLLICDEIQTGIGRTGKDFAFQYEIDKPDMLILGKALGGGMYPLSAVLGREDVMNTFDPGSHGSTFGGNPLAAAIGLEAIEMLLDENLAEKSAELGNYLIDQLRKIAKPYDFVRDVRGAGLWVGMDFDPEVITAKKVCHMLLDKGLLSKDTNKTVIRFAPPLVITKEEIDWGVDKMKEVLAEIASTH